MVALSRPQFRTASNLTLRHQSTPLRQMAPYDPSLASRSSRNSSIQSDRHLNHSHLHPEDAIITNSPPRRMPRKSSPLGRSDTVTTATSSTRLDARQRRDKRRGRSSSRRRRQHQPAAHTTWKKLLWVKQSYPDNYTDEETFLDHLQRNPRLRPYEFWPLVADSTIIVQHVCSVVIFVCCFTAIRQGRVGPQTVVGWATGGTVAGWVLRDWWQSRDEAAEAARKLLQPGTGVHDGAQTPVSSYSTMPIDLGISYKDMPLPSNGTSGYTSRAHSRNPSLTSINNLQPLTPLTPVTSATTPLAAPTSPTISVPPYPNPSAFSQRNQDRLATAKSALLIYFSLLGLSPILKSLTLSTSSDSIWALSTWLMSINVFTFDYGAGPEAKFPASLSTNAALMASTVLASRLPTTTHVFSLTLFSIEVFGLFPVFRRHLRHQSWTGHLSLTVFLVGLAGGSLGMVISGGGWGMGIVGVVLGGLVTGLSMGVTSWWLIGLQRFKNEIHGPWDPARPIIRRGWD